MATRPKAKAAKHLTRVVIPDSHGSAIDVKAAKAFLQDLKTLAPDEIVMLGDHMDVSGTFSSHPRAHAAELNESYTDDVNAANGFLDAIQQAAPNARIHYIEGNHEARCERWATKNFHTTRDVELVLMTMGPQAVLRLKERDIKYYRTGTYYGGLSIPGTLRLGKVFFCHGISHSKNAASVHLARFGANVVFGHIHRSQSAVERTVTSDAHGSWCPGTLAQLQMFYMHTAPSSHTHGYAVQYVNQSTGRFLHLQVPIYKGSSALVDVDRGVA